MWYQTLLPRILNMSITGSIVILFVLLARLVFRKAPRVLSYTLWAVVLFRLLCPVSLSADFSILSLLDVPVTQEATIEYIPHDIVSSAFPQVDFLVEDASDMVNAALPQGEEQVETAPLSEYVGILTAVWVLGAIWMLVHSMLSLRRLSMRLRGARPVGDGTYLTSGLDTPIVMGVFRPRIYLPEGLSPAERNHVLLHERCHIRRGDHVIRLLSFTALCVHWFNPLVWLAFHLSDKDMEMSCDEAVVRGMTQDMRCDYSQSLLRLSTGRRTVAAGPLSFCEGDPKSRIKGILSWKNPRLTTWIAGGCVCALLALSLLTDPVFATETVQPFQGRLHLDLPEGFDYMLLDDPSFNGDAPNIVIYRPETEYAVSAGCISLDFTPDVFDLTGGWGDATTVTLGSGNKATAYHREDGSFSRLKFDTERFGSIWICGHNNQIWSREEEALFDSVIQNISVTGPVPYSTVLLSGGAHLTVKAGALEGYNFWTDGSAISFDFSDARGAVTVELYEAYTDKLVDSFRTHDAAAQDHHTFSGLTQKKQYYLVVSGNPDADISVF